MRIIFTIKFLEYTAVVFLALCIGMDARQKENLGEGVNSHYTEITPTISPDGKTLYFTRDKHPLNTEGMGMDGNSQDIWYSELQPDGRWGEAKNIGPPLNNVNSNFVQSVSPDGNTLLIGGSYRYGTEKGVFITHKTKSGWSYPEMLKIADQHKLGQHVNYFLTNDNKVLLQEVYRRDSYGSNDIYVSFLLESGYWSVPLNLGPVINTGEMEGAPFLASDGRTLYFASAGHRGYGSTDIFVSKRLDSSWQNWSEPKNLGSLINTRGWDYYYRLSASGDYAYLVSENPRTRNSDIYRIKLPDSLKPEPVVLISGKVYNKKSKMPAEALIYYEILPDGTEAGTARSNPMDGSYKIVLPAGAKYGYRAEAEGFLPISNFIDTEHITDYNEIERDLLLVPIEKDETIRINNVFFDYDKAVLKSESFPELNRLARFLIDNPTVKILIAGHTDNAGSTDYNNKLSLERAVAVRDYLTGKGIDRARAECAGYGKEQPAAANNTPEGQQQNRRVEFKIIDK